MIIGAQRLTFHVLPADTSKALAQRIKDRLWARFKVSLAEVEDTGADVSIGVAVVGVNEAHVREKLESIIRHLNEWGNVELIHDESEVIHFADLEMERDFEKYNP